MSAGRVRRASQVVQGAFDPLQVVVGHLGVEQGGLDVLVAQELLDEADVGARLQEVGGIRVPQAVDADRLVDAGLAQGLFEDGLGAACRVRTAVLALEQVFLGAVFAEVGAELFQDAGGQGHVPVLLALGPADMHLHVAAVDVRHLQPHQFAHAQA